MDTRSVLGRIGMCDLIVSLLWTIGACGAGASQPWNTSAMQSQRGDAATANTTARGGCRLIAGICQAEPPGSVFCGRVTGFRYDLSSRCFHYPVDANGTVACTSIPTQASRTTSACYVHASEDGGLE